MKTWEILCCICFGVILTLFSWPFATFWIASELFIRNYLINSLPSITQPLFSPAIWPLAYDPFLFSTLPLATNIWVSASYTFHWTKNTVLHLIPHPTTGCSLKLPLYLYKLHLPIHDQWSTLSISLPHQQHTDKISRAPAPSYLPAFFTKPRSASATSQSSQRKHSGCQLLFIALITRPMMNSPTKGKQYLEIHAENSFIKHLQPLIILPFSL